MESKDPMTFLEEQDKQLLILANSLSLSALRDREMMKSHLYIDETVRHRSFCTFCTAIHSKIHSDSEGER